MSFVHTNCEKNIFQAENVKRRLRFEFEKMNRQQYYESSQMTADGTSDKKTK